MFVSAADAEESRRVLFVLGAAEDAIAGSDSLREAVEAQLAGAEAQVVFARFEERPITLGNQLTRARALALEYGVAAVFWLDTTEEGDWLLYLTEPDTERILVRRIEVENVAAGTEAVGVITSRSIAALFSGQTIGMQPVTLDQKKEVSPFEPPPARPAQPKPPPPDNAQKGLRIASGYRGTTYSDEVAWQHGVSLGAYWLSRQGAYGGLALSSTSASVVQTDIVAVDLVRTGGEAALGWRFGRAPLALDLEALYLGELVSRSVVGALDELEQSPTSRRWQSAVGGQARGEVSLTRSLGVFLGFGAHLVLNDFQSIAIIDGQSRVILDPHKARWVATAGLTVWP